MIFKRDDLMKGDDVAVQECANRVTERHSHDFLEFVYVLGGSAEHTINDRSTIISKGDYFLINIRSTHEYRAISGEEDFSVINCLFRPSFIEKSLSDRGGLEEILNDFLVEFGHGRDVRDITDGSYHDADGFVGTLMRRMLEEYEGRRRGSREILRHLLICLLVCLARNEGDAVGAAPGIARAVKKYVAENYMRPLRLSTISRELNFSLTYTSLSFRRETDMSFRDYLTKVRVEKAADLLRLTDKTVAEIASLVGYEDDTFFYRAFRRCLGVTPSRYRAEKREK